MPATKKSIWISYDLGLKGDFAALYAWLDNHNAIECGHGLAFLNYQSNSTTSEGFLMEIKDDLSKNVNLSPSDRMYLIWKEFGKPGIKGIFINGSRKQPPWEGYGKKGQTSAPDISE